MRMMGNAYGALVMFTLCLYVCMCVFVLCVYIIMCMCMCLFACFRHCWMNNSKNEHRTGFSFIDQRADAGVMAHGERNLPIRWPKINNLLPL